MGPMTAEMLDIDSQDRLEVASSEDEHPVGAFTLERADEPIGKCVGLGALIGVRTNSKPLRAEDLVEGGRVLRVPVAD